jgi:multidrug efflux system membrane fusion protein
MALLGVIVLVPLLGADRSLGQSTPPPPQAGPAVPVTVARAEKRDLPIYASGIGTVQAWNAVNVTAEVTGYLQSINFTEGQEVKRGDLLAEIDPRPYAAVLAQAEARKAADQANLVNDQVNLRRDNALARNDFASRQQVDNDTALVRQFEANVQADDAAIQAAELNLEFCRITSPVDGVVGFRLVDIGNLVQANGTQPLFTVMQIRPVAVVFTLGQQMLPQVQAALAKGKPEVLAFSPDGATELAGGTLLTPNNAVDVTTGTISLKAIFPNDDRKLWPGQFVQGHLRLRTDPAAVVVPLAAVQHGPDGLYVFVVKPDGTAVHQNVTVGYQDNRLAEITQGLQGSETVIVDGQARVQNGTRVSAKPAAATS